MAYVGSSGTLIGAALQSAGYYYQSWALDAFMAPYRGVNFLIYLGGLLAMVTSFALYGRAKNVLWAVIGPAIFLAIIMSRTSADGAQWRFGSQQRDQAKVTEKVEAMTGVSAYRPQVSMLFAKFDEIVSSTIRSIVDTLNAGKADRDLKMLSRAQLYGMMMSRELVDPGVSELVHLSLLGDCRELIRAGREMADGRNPPAERCEWAKSYRDLSLRQNVTLGDNGARYLAGLSVDHPQLATYQTANTLSQELAAFQAGFRGTPGISCDLAVPGGATGAPTRGSITQLANAAALQDQAAVQSMGGSTTGEIRSPTSLARAEASLAPREAAVDAKFQEVRSKSYTCHQVWDSVYASLHYEAARTLVRTRSESGKMGLDQDSLMQDLDGATGQGGQLEVVRAISRKIFRNEAAKGSTSSLIKEYSRAGASVSAIGVQGDATAFENEKAVSDMREFSAKKSLFATAASLPYYQGLFLFVLSIAFPFFAMLLLVPGKFNGFFLWFGLWIWVKSWDIGFAVAAFVDDVLFALFSVDMTTPAKSAAQALDPNFSLAVLSLRDVDPTFQLSTYYQIMGVVIGAIPMITANLIVGGAFGSSQIIESGVSRIAMVLGQGFQRAQSQLALDSYRGSTLAAQMQRGLDYLGRSSAESPDGAMHPENSVDRSAMVRPGDLHLQQTPLSLYKHSQQASVAEGFLDGIGRGTGLGRIGGGFDALPSLGGALANRARDSMTTVAETRLRTINAWAIRDADVNTGLPKSLDAVRHGALAVPWNPDDDAYRKQFEEELAAWEQLVATGATVTSSVGDVISKSLTPAPRSQKR